MPQDLSGQETLGEVLKRLQQMGYPPMEPEEYGRWEIVRLESLDAETGQPTGHTAYGFRNRYNDLIVGGLCDLETAQLIHRHHLATSYADQELERQTY